MEKFKESLESIFEEIDKIKKYDFNEEELKILKELEINSKI